MEYAEAQVSMIEKDIEIGLVAIDEASGVVAAASDKINASVQQVSDSQNKLATAVDNTISPLTQSEQAQMNNASAALQLKYGSIKFAICPTEP